MKYTALKYTVVVSVFSFLIGAWAPASLAKTDLKIKGNVIGYSLPGLYTSLFSYNSLLVRVRKVVQGKERSQYVRVRFAGTDPAYVPSNFSLETLFEIRLNRIPSCDTTFGELKGFEFRRNEGGPTERSAVLTFVPGVEKDVLSDGTRLPCYLTDDSRISKEALRDS